VLHDGDRTLMQDCIHYTASMENVVDISEPQIPSNEHKEKHEFNIVYSAFNGSTFNEVRKYLPSFPYSRYVP